jgi:hypothetical protein
LTSTGVAVLRSESKRHKENSCPNSVYRADDGGLQITDKPIEKLIGVTTDAAAIDQLKTLGIAVAAKSLTLDRDSDFGLVGIDEGDPPFKLLPKELPRTLRQDTGEFLLVDTTRLPARTQTVTVSINWLMSLTPDSRQAVERQPPRANSRCCGVCAG